MDRIRLACRAPPDLIGQLPSRRRQTVCSSSTYPPFRQRVFRSSRRAGPPVPRRRIPSWVTRQLRGLCSSRPISRLPHYSAFYAGLPNWSPRGSTRPVRRPRHACCRARRGGWGSCAVATGLTPAGAPMWPASLGSSPPECSCLHRADCYFVRCRIEALLETFAALGNHCRPPPMPGAVLVPDWGMLGRFRGRGLRRGCPAQVSGAAVWCGCLGVGFADVLWLSTFPHLRCALAVVSDGFHTFQ